MKPNDYWREPERQPSGEWEDEFGVWHSSIPDLVGTKLGFCGCGDHDAAVEMVAEALKLIDAKDWDRLKALIGTGALAFVFLSVLDDHDLIEHGSIIDYPWLTDAGKAVLGWLREENQ